MSDLTKIAHAIGYHRGRMRAEQNLKAIEVDIEAFEALLDKAPNYRYGELLDAYNAGITEGDK